MIVSLPIFYDLKHFQPMILMLLQIMEIIRFLITKPYYAMWRNIYRLALELIMLAFFTCIFINTYLIEEIVLNNPDTLEANVRMYYNVGWAGFFFVFAFNIGFLVLWGIDVARGFKYSNRELME